MQSDTNYEKVVHFNKLFGVPVNDKTQQNIFRDDPKLVSLRLKLIQEEVRELEEAIRDGDMTETVDALADILDVVYGAGASFGINMDQAFNIVHESNMSKVCKDTDEALKTVEMYKSTREEYDRNNPAQAPLSPSYRKASIGDGYVVYNSTTGKVLKSVNYTPADFKKML